MSLRGLRSFLGFAGTLLACRASPPGPAPKGSEPAALASTPAPARVSAPSEPNPAPLERLLEWGCALLKDGRTICPDPERGTPELGCATRITPSVPAPTEQ